jgi:hypothetical protein
MNNYFSYKPFAIDALNYDALNILHISIDIYLRPLTLLPIDWRFGVHVRYIALINRYA